MSGTCLLFSAISIWFSRSPLSVVSACSIFQLKFSISASSWACWYSNWKQEKMVKGGKGKNPLSYQFFPRAGFYVISIRICILQGVSALGQQLGRIKQILPVNPCATPRHHFILHKKKIRTKILDT